MLWTARDVHDTSQQSVGIGKGGGGGGGGGAFAQNASMYELLT